MRICLFCDTTGVMTGEHVWPDWILRQPRFDTAINQKIGSRPNIELRTDSEGQGRLQRLQQRLDEHARGNQSFDYGRDDDDISLSLNGLVYYTTSLYGQ